MVGDLGNCSGADEGQLVHFLIKLQPVLSIAPNFPSDVMKLILPYTSGQLFHMWLNAIQVNVGWDKLHMLSLSRFFLGIQRRRLEAHFVRDNNYQQSFCNFVESIVAEGNALRSYYTERQLIDVILLNIPPRIRSHIVFNTK